MEFLCNEKGTRDVHKSWSCVLQDIGFRCIEKVVTDKSIENS